MRSKRSGGLAAALFTLAAVGCSDANVIGPANQLEVSGTWVVVVTLDDASGTLNFRLDTP